MKKSYLTLSFLKAKTKLKIFPLLLFGLIFQFTIVGQTIPASDGSAACAVCAPTGWSIDLGTPDVSNATQAAASGTAGGGATWNVPGGVLPLPPNGHTSWISLRDLGPSGNEEIVSATMGGLTVGRTYEVTLYTLTARTNADGQMSQAYSAQYNDEFRYVVGSYPMQTIAPITQDVWGTEKFRFVASATSETLQLLPGNNSAGGSANYESVQISVTLNAIVEVPVAMDDNLTTTEDAPLNGDVFADNGNGADQLGTLPSTVTTYDAVSANGGTVLVNPNGTFSYIPSAGFTGYDSFTYTITDSNGAQSIGTVFILIEKDSDGDLISDNNDPDDDNDGVLDIDECSTLVNEAWLSGNYSVYTVGGLTDGSGYQASNWEADVLASGGVLSSVEEWVGSAPFSGADYSIGISNVTLADGTTEDRYQSGNGGTGITYRPFDPDGANPSPYVTTVTLSFTNPVNAVGFDMLELFDYQGIYQSRIEILADGVPVWQTPDSYGVGLNTTGPLDYADGSGTVQGQMTFGQNIENFVGLISPTSFTTVTINFYVGVVEADNPVDPNDDPFPDFQGFDSLRYGAIAFCDNDGDGIANIFDTDDDGDGILTADEDADGDGNPANDDTDGDGIPNYLDLDSDNDGITDIIEAGGTDVDGDGMVDGFTDVDGDGHDDNVAATPYPMTDSDGDGIANLLDLDSDNDGLTDATEAGGTDLDGDGYIDGFVDANSDGLDDATAATPLPLTDYDGDLIPDYLDVDSDNDGITDASEAGAIDLDGDGSVDGFTDVNLDGLDDAIAATPLTPGDMDGDGILNYLDLDSDADGISDIIEAGGTDTDGDGEVDYAIAGDPTSMTDTNGNGLADAIDPLNGGVALPVPNTDGTGNPDFVDIDADGDGIVDNIESQVSALGLGGYRTPSGSDDDGDGIDNSYDIDNIGNIVPIDTDSDGSPDYIDTNADDDADNDLLEGWDTDNDGTANFNPTGGDTDGDGLDNGFDLVAGPDPTNGGQNASTFPDLDTPGGEPDWREPLDIDWDNDGIDDPIDLDDDNDGITDVVESFGNDPNGDEDGDGIVNWLDTSDDGSGDGSATDYADADGNGIPDVYDFDGDGVPNHFDLDSDNDGIYDVFESGQLNGTTVVDLTLDGILDGNPADFGANGLLNLIETDDTGAATTTQPASDSDTDGIPDSLELNADGDGCPDVTEAGFTDLDGSERLGTETGLTVDVNGLVNTPGLTDGYTEPADGDANGIYDFQEVGEQVTIAVQPTDQTVILNANANFDVTLGNGVNPTYQWFESIDGGATYTALTNGGIYSGADTAALTINANTLALDGNRYRVIISAPGYACGGDVTSDSVLLTVYPDFDGDGIGDPIDLDDDNDGILDTVEGTGDLDGDGQPNHQDMDADGDGIYDIYESGQTTGVDVNGDGMLDGAVGVNGIPDSVDPADDGNLNYTIQNTDGDAQPDFLDRDDDNDGVVTANEGRDPNGDHNPADARDTDGDGRPNYLDIDDDGDGLLTRHEGTTNPDGDGRQNYLDLDSDGDGIPDNVEGQLTASYVLPSGTDTDNDGLDDAYDTNTSGYANSGGILANTVNTDAGTSWSDATPDYLDLDSDGDTVPDSLEGHDLNYDGLVDVGPSGDADNDGLDDSYDTTIGYADPNGSVVTTSPEADMPDTDGTDDVNYRDRDDDGDSILTIYENPDPNSDGDFSDSQNSDAPTGDIFPDYLDADDDGDGIPTILENPDPNGDGNPGDAQDIDGDGIPDYLDDDDDNDGIATIDEDINNDGDPTNDDTDGDGIANYLDIDDDNDGILTITEGDNLDDYDLDGVPDYLDLDSDDDGLTDNVESQTTADYVLPTGTDTDSDGLDDAYDSNDGGYPDSIGIVPTNTDGADNADYLDLDSDNDLVPDSIEGHDYDANGEADIMASGTDSDNDGLDDAYDGSVGDYADPNGLFVDSAPVSDLPNRDVDVAGIYGDIAEDTQVDFRDSDDDGDGIPTAEEDGDMDGDPTNDDCDEDGTPDYLDYTSCSIVPEAFSPNGDGVNDTLVIPALAQYPNFTMEVYDRWGNIVYEYKNNGRTQPIWWDGYSTGSRTINKGQRVPVGTYFYIINYNQDRIPSVSGWVYVNY